MNSYDFFIYEFISFMNSNMNSGVPVKFEQIPFFYPRGCAAPLRGITPIAALERFVVYCSSELIISGSAPGRCQEGTGNCSSFYEAQANLKVKTQSWISNSWTRVVVGVGRRRKVEAEEVAERIALRSAPGCRWRQWTSRRQRTSRR